MDNAQLPRRKAAIKATTQLADISSSSDEGDARHEDKDYVAAQRVNGAKVKTNSKRAKTHHRKHSAVGSVDLGTDPNTTSARKRKGGAWNVTGPSRKRQRGATYVGGVPRVGGGVDDDSDLTPLSSDDEQEEDQTSQRPPADFPLQLTPVASRSHHDTSSGSKAGTRPLPGISDLDDDSDDLPDVGMMLSQQQDVSTSKTPNDNVSARKRKSLTQTKRTRDTPCIFGSSPTSPTMPPSSLPLSLYGRPSNEDAETEPDISDYSDLAEFSDDSDLDLDGELCLARAKSGDTFYWPAKVLQVKNTTGKGKGKQKKMFHVMFLDKKEKDIPRDWFYTSSQEEFCTCSVS
ncbi:hypothetical protein P691DRAFT_262291 [Macrolepiota fuliginosa MF-IS2]|uniref:PWWP domain-containing protein n=1 Tax=Macrolepiota fuliginosa MF-IS2 TaxID=1400762 RepID=A0A9P5X6T0_9AGAR|nr:hypothetical protein P691DRAFT_262291 [Macrolepiota fuliginosa MF-IS2]